MGRVKGAYKILVANPDGKIPLERTRHKWEYNIMIDIKEGG
jgi:hypothetical protein